MPWAGRGGKGILSFIAMIFLPGTLFFHVARTVSNCSFVNTSFGDYEWGEHFLPGGIGPGAPTTNAPTKGTTAHPKTSVISIIIIQDEAAAIARQSAAPIANIWWVKRRD
jgi:hypothetical protein